MKIYVWTILGTYQGETEVIDEFDTKAEARTNLAEYRLAYGQGWYLRLKRMVSTD